MTSTGQGERRAFFAVMIMIDRSGISAYHAILERLFCGKRSDTDIKALKQLGKINSAIIALMNIFKIKEPSSEKMKNAVGALALFYSESLINGENQQEITRILLGMIDRRNKVHVEIAIDALVGFRPMSSVMIHAYLDGYNYLITKCAGYDKPSCIHTNASGVSDVFMQLKKLIDNFNITHSTSQEEDLDRHLREEYPAFVIAARTIQTDTRSISVFLKLSQQAHKAALRIIGAALAQQKDQASIVLTSIVISEFIETNEVKLVADSMIACGSRSLRIGFIKVFFFHFTSIWSTVLSNILFACTT